MGGKVERELKEEEHMLFFLHRTHFPTFWWQMGAPTFATILLFTGVFSGRKGAIFGTFGPLTAGNTWEKVRGKKVFFPETFGATFLPFG